jgi:hypothetical protein
LAHERAFVADASHELRTPLAILKTELDLAMNGDYSTEELDATIRSAAEETERLARIAEDLLVLSSSEHGELPVIAERVDARELLARVVKRYEARARELGGHWRCMRPENVTLVGDQLRLEQAVGNMLDNALRHGGGRVLVAAEEQDARIRPARQSTRARGSPRISSAAPSSASAAPTRRARAAAPAWGSRWSRGSPSPTAVRRGRGIASRAGPTSGLSVPRGPARRAFTPQRRRQTGARGSAPHAAGR